MTWLILSMIFLPAATAALMLLLDAQATPVRARWAALFGTVATFVVSWAVAVQFMNLPRVAQPFDGPIQPRVEIKQTWLTIGSPALESISGKPFRMEFFLGLDGISLALVLLTTLLSISAVLVSWTAITERAAEFYACLLILETGLVGVFCAFDLVLFYVFFEFTLIPLFFLIGIWGGPLKQYAAYKFFLYTLAGSLITLVGLVALVLTVRQRTPLETPFSLPDLAQHLSQAPLPLTVQIPLFLAISAGFLVKVPLFPFHTWLPLAHVEAPTAGSVILAGVLLKLGTYGFLRLCLPMFRDACEIQGVPLIAVLSVIGIVYGSLCALAQNDIKKLVAYSSVAHLGFCMLGLFALNREGISGGILQMINHGLSTGALFCLVGMFYERYHTRLLSELGGLANRLPRLATALVFITLASIGLPGLNGFVGEVLCLIGMFGLNSAVVPGPLYAAFGAVGIVLGAWYMLGMLQRAFFGPLKEPPSHGRAAPIRDLNARETLALAPLAFCCLWIGLFPQPLLELIRPDVEALVRDYEVRAPLEVEERVALTQEARP
jgi:NADH-quinone oxidoreductase subunit M